MMSNPVGNIRNLLQNRAEFLKRSPFFSKNAIQFLNIAQFFGAVNDNAFKFLCVFLLISIKGIDASSTILFWVGTVYVLPFLLFSSSGGIIADRVSKQKIIVGLKVFELGIAILGIFAFVYKSEVGCYIVLSLFAFQSALFGPPKYSVIAEIVPRESIPKANGLITSFTYLAIILGTFLASFSTYITGKNFVLTGIMCLIISILGLAGSLLIPHTEPKRSKKKVHPLFFKEIYDTLKFCKSHRNLRTCIFGNAVFLYVGAFIQLNVIPLAIESLGMSEEGGGYLFLTVAVGIAIGAVLAGKISRKQPELGVACFASFLFFVALMALSFLHTHLILVFLLLTLVGFVGGFFIVPFDSYLQTHSPDQMRGQIVAASNFMGFCGVLLAPLSIYLFSGILGLSAAKGFLIVSLLVLIATRWITARLAGQFFNFSARKILKRLYRIDIQRSPFPITDGCTLLIENGSWLKAMLISICSPHIKFYYIKKRHSFADWLFRAYNTITPFYLDRFTRSNAGTLIDYFSFKKSNEVSCLLLPKGEKTLLPSRINTNKLYSVAFSFGTRRSVSIVFE
jgi:acyl-[acyl-carrier-protein]-phospholipid O-acyltransferase / long-chain-fatty-acid--[acyl-carrier-protein] ligase